jgi:site-specific recombinase XerD
MNNHLENFLNYLKIEKNASHNTVVSYKKDITQYIEECDIESIEQLNKATIRAFLAGIMNLAPTTRRRNLSSIRSFMSYLTREGIIEKNDALEIANAKVDRRLPEIMSVNETASIIESATSEQDRAILETLYGLGCRVSELVNIKISDIDFEERTVKLFGKGNKERIVPINNSAINAIKQHINTRKYSSDYVFASKNNPNISMTDRNARRIVYKYTNGDVHPHMFRHSYATHLHGNGVDIRIIQGLLGHSNINTTTIYTSLANENMSKAYRHAHPRG